MRFDASLSHLPVVVFFEDEARFGRISREMACWVRSDMIPTVARQMIREYIYAYSALCPQSGDCYSRISPCCNTEAMNEFLQQISVAYAHYRIIIILDKAGWHVSRTLQLAPNIQLMHLAPYSPELNPVELLWREVRRKHFHNRIFDTLDAVENNLEKALKEWHHNKIGIQRLSVGFIPY